MVERANRSCRPQIDACGSYSTYVGAHTVGVETDIAGIGTRAIAVGIHTVGGGTRIVGVEKHMRDIETGFAGNGARTAGIGTRVPWRDFNFGHTPQSSCLEIQEFWHKIWAIPIQEISSIDYLTYFNMKNQNVSGEQNPIASPGRRSVATAKDASGPTDTFNAVTVGLKKPISRLNMPEFYAWLIEFAPVFSTLSEKLGFVRSVADSTLNDAEWAAYITLRESMYVRTLDLTRLFRTTFFEGNKPGQNTPNVPTEMVEPPAPKFPMVPDVYTRMVNLVAQIRKSPEFNDVIAAQLGLDWKPGSSQQASELSLAAFQTTNGLQLKWTKGGIKNGAAYFEYDPTGKGDESNFQYLQTATKSPLALMPNLPEGVSAAVWAVRYCVIEGNEPTKVWSNVVQATVSTVVNKPAAAVRARTR